MNDSFYLIAPEAHFYELSTLIREYIPLVNVVPTVKEGIPGIVLSADERSGIRYLENGQEAASFVLEDSFDGYVGEKSKNEAKVVIARLMGSSLPWGILTGVRPTKVAFQYLETGLSEEEIAQVLEERYLLRRDKAELCAGVARAERAILADHDGLDVSLYVGILFCPTRCSYCSFISNDQRAYRLYAKDYVEAVLKEMEECAPLLRGRRIRSFYMGGGTPTTLDEESLRRILCKADELFDFSAMDEVTVEAGRPDTITPGKLRVLKECGVDRISINPQTMNQATLDRIGRAHRTEEIEAAFQMAREAGFDNINADLIVGLPGEEAEDVARTMERIRALKPENVTVHTLAVKRSSRMNEFGEGAEMLKEETSALAEKIDRMIGIAAKACEEMGLKPYYMYRQKNMAGNFENVGYALPGKEGRYNIEIMEERQSIVAFGAGGVTKVYTPEENRIERVPNVKGVKEYIERIDEMIERKKEGLKS